MKLENAYNGMQKATTGNEIWSPMSRLDIMYPTLPVFFHMKAFEGSKCNITDII